MSITSLSIRTIYESSNTQLQNILLAVSKQMQSVAAAEQNVLLLIPYQESLVLQP